MGRNSIQNNTKTQNTQNKKQNIQNKKTNRKRIIKNTKINYNIIENKRHKANISQTVTRPYTSGIQVCMLLVIVNVNMLNNTSLSAHTDRAKRQRATVQSTMQFRVGSYRAGKFGNDP